MGVISIILFESTSLTWFGHESSLLTIMTVDL